MRIFILRPLTPAALVSLSHAAMAMGVEIAVEVRPNLDSAALAFKALADSMCQDSISPEILRKESAWERRNRNAPFYRNLKKNRR